MNNGKLWADYSRHIERPFNGGDDCFIAVRSSNIAEVAYKPDSMMLYVRFHNERTYVYSPVARDVFEDFAQAESLGGYLNAVIKPHFDCKRVY